MKRRVREQVRPQPPAGLDRCVVEDWAPADDPVGEWESRQGDEYLRLHFERTAWRRFRQAQHDAGVSGPAHRPSWRGTPYPDLPGWEPTVVLSPLEAEIEGVSARG